MSQDRTEKPTAKRLEDARKKGQIARSRDLAAAMATIAAAIALGRLGGSVLGGLSQRLATDLSHFGDAPLRPVTSGDLMALVMGGGTLMVMLVGPIALSMIVVGVGAQGLQGGWSFAPEALQLKWDRLSPANGLKRFAFLQSGLDTVKTFFAVAVIAWLAWQSVMAFIEEGTRLPWMTALAAAQRGWTYAESFMWKVGWGLAALGLGDYGLQRYRLTSSLRMTKQEIKDEHKQQDGNPQVKGRIRRIQRDMARRRMVDDVKKATVVITNPTHFAVALAYRRGSMAAPVVLAKGRDHLAAAIRERARLHGVPMVENKPLAQALFKTAEVGDTIPADLFAAVAEVLAQLIRLKQLIL